MEENYNNRISEQIIRDIKELEIDCPDCGGYYMDDDQYTCTTCWCEGGKGKINVFNWLRENKNILEQEWKVRKY